MRKNFSGSFYIDWFVILSPIKFFEGEKIKKVDSFEEKKSLCKFQILFFFRNSSPTKARFERNNFSLSS